MPVQALPTDEIATRLSNMPAWQLKDDKLYCSLRFEDFATAFGFMASVALVAEGLDHHPEWSNVYNRVDIYLTTHDCAAISERDFALAEAIDRLAP